MTHANSLPLPGSLFPSTAKQPSGAAGGGLQGEWGCEPLLLPGVTGQDGEQGGAVSARPLGHTLKTTGLQDLLEQRVEVKTPR